MGVIVWDFLITQMYKKKTWYKHFFLTIKTTESGGSSTHDLSFSVQIITMFTCLDYRRPKFFAFEQIIFQILEKNW